MKLREIDIRVDEAVSIDKHPEGACVIAWIADEDWNEYTTFTESVNLDAGEQLWHLNMEEAKKL